VRKNPPKEYYKVAIISDLHAHFLDERAFSIFMQIYKQNHYDLLVINGDLCDFSTLSRFAHRIETFNPSIIRNYDLKGELEFVEHKILAPLHDAQKKTPILWRMGNHEKRFLRPTKDSGSALGEILEQCRELGGTKLDQLLHLDKYNVKTSYKNVDILRNKFVMTHGTLLAANRCEKYLRDYMMSGVSSHTHQGLRAEKVVYGRPDIEWVESFCLRTIRDVEYHEEGHIPNWSHGFVDVWFEKGSGKMYIKQHKFNNYEAKYGDKIYKA
jgi:predicted phosphodiesterase